MFEKLKNDIKARKGYLQIDTDKCTYCGICQNRCPVNAITVSNSSKEWRVDNEKCIRCGRCSRKCPNFALSIVKKL